MLNPSSIPPSEIIRRADVIWKRRGIRPKQHLSEPRPGAVTLMERRAHADRCEALPIELPDDMGESVPLLLHVGPCCLTDGVGRFDDRGIWLDKVCDSTEANIIIQAKDKEQAVFQLYRMYNLSPVIHGKLLTSLNETRVLMNGFIANLRPPNPAPTKETAGRKSQKRITRATAAVRIDLQLEESEVVDIANGSSQADTPGASQAQGGCQCEPK